jgi:hypothetical protein
MRSAELNGDAADARVISAEKFEAHKPRTVGF